MPNFIPTDNEIASLEAQRISSVTIAEKSLLQLRLTAYYVFKDIEKAQQYIKKIEGYIQRSSDFTARFYLHLSAASIENNLYHFQSAQAHCLKAIEIANEYGSISEQAEVFIDYAGICINLGLQEEANNWLTIAKKLLKAYPNPRLLARLTGREGFLYLHGNDHKLATALLLEAEKQFAQLEDQNLKDAYFLNLVYSGLGRIYELNDDFTNALAIYLKVMRMCESLGIRMRMSWHYLNVGKMYMFLNETEKAEIYFRKVVQIKEDLHSQARAGAYGNLGYCYFLKKKYSQAATLYSRAETYYKQRIEENYHSFSVLETRKAKLYTATKKFGIVAKHLALAFEYARLSGDYKQISGVCKEIASYYAESGDYKSAYEYHLLHSEMNEKHAEEVNDRKIKEIEVRYESEKKQREAEMFRMQATGLQRKALRAQMNPHFLYNALNSIQDYITSNEVVSASKYLAKFAKLMRQSLYYSDLEIISLEKEIDFLKDYLIINQKLRFDDRLQFQINIAEDIEEDILGVPTMIVQPYIENAIEHGIRPKKGGFIRVDFSMYDDNTIFCVVEDNGIGREKMRQLQAADAAYQEHKSRGTGITERRLEILHSYTGPDKKINVQTIDLHDPTTKEATGTRVEILIPVMEIYIIHK
jgi:two-component system, LytTR family, sensor kinase